MTIGNDLWYILQNYTRLITQANPTKYISADSPTDPNADNEEDFIFAGKMNVDTVWELWHQRTTHEEQIVMEALPRCVDDVSSPAAEA